MYVLADVLVKSPQELFNIMKKTEQDQIIQYSIELASENEIAGHCQHLTGYHRERV